MESLYPTEKKGISKVMIGSLAIAVILIAGAVYLLSLQPTREEHKEQVLADALKQGSPEFEDLTKEIIITTDANNTLQSITGLGTISMTIPATIRNKSDKTVTLLEVKIGVVNKQNEMIKEKNVIVVPSRQADVLTPGETIRIVQNLDGFKPEEERAQVRWLVTAIKVK